MAESFLIFDVSPAQNNSTAGALQPRAAEFEIKYSHIINAGRSCTDELLVGCLPGPDGRVPEFTETTDPTTASDAAKAGKLVVKLKSEC